MINHNLDLSIKILTARLVVVLNLQTFRRIDRFFISLNYQLKVHTRLPYAPLGLIFVLLLEEETDLEF